MTCPTCSKPIAPTGKRGRPRKYHEGCEPVRRKVRGGLTTAALVERTRADAEAIGAEPLTGPALLEPFAAAGLVERRGRTWVVLDPAVRAGFGPDQDLGEPLEEGDLRLINTGPRPGGRGSTPTRVPSQTAGVSPREIKPHREAVAA